MNCFLTITISLAFIAFFCFVICKLQFFAKLQLKARTLIFLFFAKIIAAFALFGIYTFVYVDAETSDLLNYHHAGKVIYSAISNNPVDYLKMVSGICADEPQLQHYYQEANVWYKAWNYGLINDNHTIIRYNAIINLITQGNIYLNLIISSFVAFLGSCFIARSMQNISPKHKILTTISAFLVPSVIFWSSGMLKECLLMFALGLLCFAWFDICKKFTVKRLLVIILAIILVFLTKIYILLAIIPGLLFFLIPAKIGKKKLSITFSAIFIGIILVFFFSEKLIGYNLVQTIVNKQHDFIAFTTSRPSTPGSNIEIGLLEPSFTSFAKNIVPAYINTLFRPFVTEANSAIKLACCIENILFFIVFIYMCLRFRMPNVQEYKFILFTLSFMLILYALLGLTTPNLGALVRYKIPVMPFLLFAMLICTDFEKMEKFFKKN